MKPRNVTLSLRDAMGRDVGVVTLRIGYVTRMETAPGVDKSRLYPLRGVNEAHVRAYAMSYNWIVTEP